MTRADIQHGVVEALTTVAPEVDAASVRPDVPLRQQVDLDSMDFLRVVVELHKRFGVSVPEPDYAKLSTVRATVDYLAAHLGVSA